MKVKRFDFLGYVFYPNILNPFCWIAVILFALNFIFLCWWETKRDGSYTVYKIKERPFRDGSKLITLGLISMFINSFWWNKGLMYSYIRYLEEVIFPYYPKEDWRRAKNIRDTYHWYLNKRLISFKNTKRQIYILEFRKEDNGEWFVVLNNWEGPKADLQMVAGADVLLDALAGEKKIVHLKVSNKYFHKSSLLIKSNFIPESGAFYNTERLNINAILKLPFGIADKIWLCDVLSFVFKGFPKKIYFRKM